MKEKVNKKNKNFKKINPSDVTSFCLGNPDYEESDSGDGFNILYFNNESF